MTDDVKRTLDEHLTSALCVILTSGHAVRNKDGVDLRQTDQGTFVVSVLGSDLGLPTERDDEFDDVRAAVALYLDLCDPV